MPMASAHGAGSTIELHGSIKQLVCPDCAGVVALGPPAARALKRRRRVRCLSCPCASMRVRIMLYDDDEGGATVGCHVPTVCPWTDNQTLLLCIS